MKKVRKQTIIRIKIYYEWHFQKFPKLRNGPKTPQYRNIEVKFHSLWLLF